MAAGLLFASSMKREGSRVNIRIKGNGPLGGLLVDAGLDGTVRGYVENPDVELAPTPYGKLDVSGAVGQEGYVYVIRDVGYGYPYSSTVELVSGEIGDDLTHYLATSEQTPSALMVGVFVDEKGVSTAGGLLIQILPKAARDESLVALLESRLATLSGFTTLLRSGQSLQDIFEQLLGDLGLEMMPEVQLVRFHCGCSHAKVLSALKLFGEVELQDMIEQDKGAEATCDFCSNRYQASEAELVQLLAEMRAEG
jgi:molecular chaperone Hsp33